MKPMKWPAESGTVFILLLTTLAWTGCTTMTVKTGEQRTLDTGSPLRGLKPLRVVVKDFEDVRGVPPDYAGQVSVKTFKLDKPAAATVQETIRREFERNGHVCIGGDSQQEADVVVEGAVYEYGVSAQTSFTTVKVLAKVGTKISVVAFRNANKVFVKKYDGSYYVSGLFVTYNTAAKMLNEALLNMTKEFNTDPELMNFLRQAAAESSGQ